MEEIIMIRCPVNQFKDCFKEECQAWNHNDCRLITITEATIRRAVWMASGG